MGVIILDGKSSKDYGIIVEIEPNYEIAERAYDVVSIPGRGDVLQDLKYYKNVDREYQIAVAEEGGDFTALAPKIAEWISCAVGYVRLEDSYYPDQYVMARINGNVNVANILKQAGRCPIMFDRGPKRFLKSGEKSYSVSDSNKTLMNPTPNDAKPLLKISGLASNLTPASLWVNGNEIVFTNIMEYIMLDCETMYAYKNGYDLSKHVTIKNDDPVLKPGLNTFVYSGTITGVEVIPRWWVL